MQEAVTVVVAIVAGAVIGLGLAAIVERIVAWRAERQLRGELEMRGGFRGIKRNKTMIRVNDAPRFDSRNSIDRFRRESGR